MASVADVNRQLNLQDTEESTILHVPVEKGMFKRCLESIAKCCGLSCSFPQEFKEIPGEYVIVNSPQATSVGRKSSEELLKEEFHLDTEVFKRRFIQSDEGEYDVVEAELKKTVTFCITKYPNNHQVMDALMSFICDLRKELKRFPDVLGSNLRAGSLYQSYKDLKKVHDANMPSHLLTDHYPTTAELDLIKPKEPDSTYGSKEEYSC